MKAGRQCKKNTKAGDKGEAPSAERALQEARTALSCLKQWWQVGAPLSVIAGNYGVVDLTEMLERLGQDLAHAIEVAGQERVTDLAKQFGMRVQLADD